ncbi:MAG: hypothetical protein Q9210_003130 [Variospora velana]
MKEAESGGAINVVMCGIDDKKDIMDATDPAEEVSISSIPMRSINRIRNDGEQHCFSNSVATTNEDEKGRQPDETDGDSTIKPTNKHDPSETEKHAGGEK